ncbi:O-antigen ligase family protein [Janthinobacterium sp. 17J80-10]|uniref:O-antigen ligase family protein n=1 Tax=Janthinobacterium sp. 17J80-10 TaxID=2497863 RepID=UPI00100534F8|nr:O-antigen ligase family protein [Janthinobacterium sp. 17J80-10]QAU35522.1 O-antigen ligase family protein [Janthinobacterium sp. 17J80-10]
MSFAARRSEWPQKVLAVLPFLLFFPIGIIYFGVVVFLFSLLLAGDYRGAWLRMKENVMFRPVVALTLLSCLAAIVLERPARGFWSSFAHYQIYLFLLLFLSVGKGDWQGRAFKSFAAGAVVASTLLYLNAADLLPHISLFSAYASYYGNKSIMVGILLALAVGFLLRDITRLASNRQVLLMRILTIVYIALPVLFLARTRTASIIFLLMCLLVGLRCLKWNGRSVGVLLVSAVMLAAVMASSSTFKTRMASAFQDVAAYSQGQKPSHQGIRLEIYALTTEIIADKPLTGHGIGTWEPLYAKLARERDTYAFATPHNDYLLYAAEMGVLGLAALLWIWLTQLLVAWRMPEAEGMPLLMLGLAIMVGGMFNAVLRDAVFGMPFMILLAIPLAGARRHTPAIAG